jgi:hypothetical protein
VLAERNGEQACPAGQGGAAAAPFVDLASADAGKTGKSGLADIGNGEESDEFGVLERPHGRDIELSSI